MFGSIWCKVVKPLLWIQKIIGSNPGCGITFTSAFFWYIWDHHLSYGFCALRDALSRELSAAERDHILMGNQIYNSCCSVKRDNIHTGKPDVQCSLLCRERSYTYGETGRAILTTLSRETIYIQETRRTMKPILKIVITLNLILTQQKGTLNFFYLLFS